MAEMAEIQAMWDRLCETQAGDSGKSGGYREAPDGDAVVILKAVELSQNEGKSPAIVPNFYFPAHNLTEKTWLNIQANEGALGALMGFFRGLKLEPRSVDPEELLRVAQQAEGWTLKVKKKTVQNGQYKNRRYYVNEIISKTGQASPEATVDEIPFNRERIKIVLTGLIDYLVNTFTISLLSWIVWRTLAIKTGLPSAGFDITSLFAILLSLAGFSWNLVMSCLVHTNRLLQDEKVDRSMKRLFADLEKKKEVEGEGEKGA